MTAAETGTRRRRTGLGLPTASLVGWAFTATGAFLLGVRSDGPVDPQSGGPYAYSRTAFGDFVGFQTAWAYWIAGPRALIKR